jgi:hypothetical protein
MYCLRSYILMKKTSLAAIFITYLILATAHASSSELSLRYEVQWGNVNVAYGEATWVFGENKVTMAGASTTLGAVDTFRKYRGSVKLEAEAIDGLYQPKSLTIEGNYKKRRKSASTVWKESQSTILTTRQPELDLERVYPLQEQHIDNSIDPFTVMLNALSNLRLAGQCDGVYKIYDGLRTATLRFHDLGKTFLASDRPTAFEGQTWRCGVTSTPTGGHRIKSRWRHEDQKIDDVVVYVAALQPELFVPVRMEIKTMVGKVTTRLVVPSVSFKQVDGE